MVAQWQSGDNGHQEYYALQGRRKYDVCRNHTENHWVIYHHGRGSTVLVSNPYPATAQLRFVEVTRLPHAGEHFGDHPGDDILPATLTPNYAWDTPEAAMRHVEALADTLSAKARKAQGTRNALSHSHAASAMPQPKPRIRLYPTVIEA